MAAHINHFLHPSTPIDASNLIFANGVTSLCEMLGFSICAPGDGILMSRPIYQAFQIDFGAKAGVKCVFTAFQGVDQFSPACVDKYEAQLQASEREGVKIKALLLCHPHNPLGQSYPRSTLIALMEFCNRHSIHLLVDEIYALSVYATSSPNAVPFQSVFSFDPTPHIDPHLLHWLYGLSKDFAAGGLRLGCLHTTNPALMDALSSITQFHWSGAANEALAADMLEDTAFLASFFGKSQALLGERSGLARRLLEERGVEFHSAANAGFFLWVSLRPWLEVEDGSEGWEAEKRLVRRMGERKVFVTDGAGMKAEEPGWFRLVFSQEEDVLREGLRRVFEAIGERKR